MMAAALLMIGGFLMMLEPLLRPPARATTENIAAVLREAFPPAARSPRSFEALLEQIP